MTGPVRYLGMLVLCLLSLAPAAPTAEAKPPLPPLPPLLLPAPPSVVVIPGSYVYFAPAVKEDLLFYQGHWYRPQGGNWYRAIGHEGPWTFVPAPPRVLITLPAGFRERHGSSEIPHDELKRNWRSWERDRHWDRHEGKYGKKQVKPGSKREHHGKKKRRGGDDDDHRGDDHDDRGKHRGSRGRDR